MTDSDDTGEREKKTQLKVITSKKTLCKKKKKKSERPNGSD
jgi:hypothetical protein